MYNTSTEPRSRPKRNVRGFLPSDQYIALRRKFPHFAKFVNADTVRKKHDIYKRKGVKQEVELTSQRKPETAANKNKAEMISALSVLQMQKAVGTTK
jgi:hypothetical protein